MKVLLASSEVVPFAKTGGLADVCGALPVELAKREVEVAVFLPAYRSTRDVGLEFQDTGIEFQIPIGSKMVGGKLLKSQLPNSEVTVYLVQQDDYFDRDGLYRTVMKNSRITASDSLSSAASSSIRWASWIGFRTWSTVMIGKPA